MLHEYKTHPCQSIVKQRTSAIRSRACIIDPTATRVKQKHDKSSHAKMAVLSNQPRVVQQCCLSGWSVFVSDLCGWSMWVIYCVCSLYVDFFSVLSLFIVFVCGPRVVSCSLCVGFCMAYQCGLAGWFICAGSVCGLRVRALRVSSAYDDCTGTPHVRSTCTNHVRGLCHPPFQCAPR